jgi:ubiquinone/menaquinone biosynthesis C-methylase UbiE
MNERPAIKITSKSSLIHIGSLDSFDITEGGQAAARCILDYFQYGDLEKLKQAVDIYEKIIPNENFGGEYTALQWISRLLLAPEEVRNEFLSYPEVASWYELLAENEYARLKEYIGRKYHFAEMPAGDGNARRSLRFLEDFILFSNPDRNRWENTVENLVRFGIAQGDVIADVGAGPGYFSFKFADIVGETGKVYAIETNPLHLNYLNQFILRYGRKNVDAVACHTEGIGLPRGVKVNTVFMCSLYHVLYAALTEDERVSYIGSIVEALLPGGKLIIVDNDLVEDGELPYHGPYISKDLITAQLWHYGFTLRQSFQFTMQRYALIYEYTGKPKDAALTNETSETDTLVIKTKTSLINYRIADAAPTAGFSPRGREAAALFWTALNTKSAEATQKALDAYNELIPLERVGDEYTAFQWFCQYLLADTERQTNMLAEDLVKSYFDMLASDNFSPLKKYLRHKYELPGYENDLFENLTRISEYVAFNNPNRDSWERTEEMLEYINIKECEAVADVGCGSGFFTYRFAKATGSGGRVYATEINQEALAYVEELHEKFQLPIVPVVNRLNDVCLPENSVDTVFMCSMYHAVYISSIEFVKDAFIDSVKRALKSGGRLIVVDNEISRPGVVPYYGSAIDRRLIIAQLSHYGFTLVDERQFVPQRYILVFKKTAISL